MPAPLRASSLSALRELQQQARKQVDADSSGTPIKTDPNPSGASLATGESARRRPHRFFPPGTSTGRPDTAQATHLTEPVVDPLPGTATANHPGSPPRALNTAGPAEAKQTGIPSPDSSTAQQLAPDDIALFRRVVQSVTPATKSDRALLPPTPEATPGQLQQRRQHAMGQPIRHALDVSDQYAPARLDHDDTLFLQSGQGPHLIKGLKKGKWPIQASLDLHGSKLDEARERMERFIQTCRDHHIRCVRIVHGKGYGSKGGDPVLKETVRRWLSQLAVVQAYVECAEADGGAGAVQVLLSKQQP